MGRGACLARCRPRFHPQQQIRSPEPARNDYWALLDVVEEKKTIRKSWRDFFFKLMCVLNKHQVMGSIPGITRDAEQGCPFVVHLFLMQVVHLFLMVLLTDILGAASNSGWTTAKNVWALAVIRVCETGEIVHELTVCFAFQRPNLKPNGSLSTELGVTPEHCQSVVLKRRIT